MIKLILSFMSIITMGIMLILAVVHNINLHLFSYICGVLSGWIICFSVNLAMSDTENLYNINERKRGKDECKKKDNQSEV